MKRFQASVRPPLVMALATLILLGVGSLKPIAAGLRSSAGVGGLMRAILAEPSPFTNRPFPCAAGSLEQTSARRLAKKALNELDTLKPSPEQAAHLLGIAYCLLGESAATWNLYKTSNGSSYAQMQQVVLGNQLGKTEQSSRLLAKAGLSQSEALQMINILINDFPDQDWRPHLSQLVSRFPQEVALWHLWLEYGTRLSMLDKWDEALIWYEKGSSMQFLLNECILCSVLYVRAGRIYQTNSDLGNLDKALLAYKLAISTHDQIETTEKSLAHLYLGEVYLALQDRYNPRDALIEFERALDLDPQSYWALIDIGRLYMLHDKDYQLAESFFRAAQANNPNNPYPYYLIGDLFQARDDPTQAEAWYRQALARQPDYQPALDRLRELGISP